VDPGARIVTVDPLIHVVPPKGKPDVGGVAAAYRASQFEAWDMLAGIQAPELGGHPKYLDIMGVNFYHDNQWEHPGGEKIHWHIHPRDPRWVPFSTLLADAYERYRLPMFIAETSHALKAPDSGAATRNQSAGRPAAAAIRPAAWTT